MRVKTVTWPSKRAATSHLAGTALQYLPQYQVQELWGTGTRRRRRRASDSSSSSSALVNLIIRLQ
jgi:hypothetical protein